jgi:hypothetical protein
LNQVGLDRWDGCGQLIKTKTASQQFMEIEDDQTRRELTEMPPRACCKEAMGVVDVVPWMPIMR